MVLPLIPLGYLAAGLLGGGIGAAAGAGIAGLTAGKKETQIQTQETYAPIWTYSPSRQETFSPTTTTTRLFQYSYAPQYVISSPYAQTESKKSFAARTAQEVIPTIAPTIAPIISPTVSPGQEAVGGGAGLPIGSMLLLGGAGLAIYALFGGSKALGGRKK